MVRDPGSRTRAPWSTARESLLTSAKSATASRQPQPRAAIFDLDGVIVDTAKYHYLAWKILADELHIPFDAHENERLKGVSRSRSLEILLDLGQLQFGETEKAVLAERKNLLYLQFVAQLTPGDLLPGVLEFLTHLRRCGLRIALASASKNAPLILAKLDIERLFDAVVDGNAVSRPKPIPTCSCVRPRPSKWSRRVAWCSRTPWPAWRRAWRRACWWSASATSPRFTRQTS